MVRKSNHSRTTLLAAIGQQVQAFQDATDEVDEAVARRLRLNRTDLRCLSVLSQAGTISASALADAAGLTRGAMTTALDRLETAGYARRVWDQPDRRAVRIEMTGEARKEVETLYGPLAQEGLAFLQRYTIEELTVVLRYLEEGRRIQRAHAERIRDAGHFDSASAPATRGRHVTQPSKKRSRPS